MKVFAWLIAMSLMASAARAAPTPKAAPATSVATTAAAAAPTAPPTKWVEGKNYLLVAQPVPTSLPKGKVLVTEVFSYACPACNQFQPYMQKLVKSLPPNAVVDYVPASFNSSEDWPMFQLAYATAQALGVAARTHDAMFDAVWTTGDLATMDPSTGTLRARMPTIEDAAKFYQKQAGVPVASFLATSKSFGVDNQVRRYEELLRAYAIDRTPTLIVNGKYRITTESASYPAPLDRTFNAQRLIDLVDWLVAQESK